MLNNLKFVQGAVSQKDFIPSMTHFQIKGGRVTAYNGIIALSSPLGFDIDCNPKAETLVKAIDKCDGTIVLNLTSTKRLSVKSGSFRAVIDCLDTDLPDLQPEGEYQEIPDSKDLKNIFKTLYPIISEDASRPWSMGLLLDNNSFFVTNNVILIQYWAGFSLQNRVNIPRAAIKEVIRIKENPIAIQLSDNSLTFHYKNERWLKTQLIDSQWPSVTALLDLENVNYRQINKDLFKAIESLKPFTDNLDRVYFHDRQLATSKILEECSSFDVNGLPNNGCFVGDMLLKLQGIADEVDWSFYPKHCPFKGENIRGIIAPMRSDI